MMNISADTWIALIALLFSVVGPTMLWLFRSTAKDEIDAAIAAAKKETDRAIAELELKIERTRQSGIEHDRRLVVIETSMRILPSKDDLHRLEVGIERLSGLIATTNSNVEHLTKQSTSNGAKLDRLEQQKMHEANA